MNETIAAERINADLQRDPRGFIETCEARYRSMVLAAADRSYDVIMVDAYQDITIPFQMSSLEFFSLVRSMT